MKSLGIIGLGRLASGFVNFYHHKASIWATSRNKEKIQENLRQKSELFNFQLGGSSHHLPIESTADLLFTIPPSQIEDYAQECIAFFKEIMEINPSLRILFISSTSVYNDKFREVDENTPAKPKSPNAKKLHEVEKFLMDYNAWILRCGGLIGDRKHPVYFLSKRPLIPKPQAAVNLIHEHDIFRFIKRLINKDKDFGVYNLVCPQHPSRIEYYSDSADRLGLNSLHFDEADTRKGKIVVPKKALEANFSFDYSSPFEMPLIRS